MMAGRPSRPPAPVDITPEEAQIFALFRGAGRGAPIASVSCSSSPAGAGQGGPYISGCCPTPVSTWDTRGHSVLCPKAPFSTALQLQALGLIQIVCNPGVWTWVSEVLWVGFMLHSRACPPCYFPGLDLTQPWDSGLTHSVCDAPDAWGGSNLGICLGGCCRDLPDPGVTGWGGAQGHQSTGIAQLGCRELPASPRGGQQRTWSLNWFLWLAPLFFHYLDREPGWGRALRGHFGQSTPAKAVSAGSEMKAQESTCLGEETLHKR